MSDSLKGRRVLIELRPHHEQLQPRNREHRNKTTLYCQGRGQADGCTQPPRTSLEHRRAREDLSVSVSFSLRVFIVNGRGELRCAPAQSTSLQALFAMSPC